MRLISLSVLLHLFIFCAIMGVTVTSPAAVCQDGNGNTYTFGERVTSDNPCEICECQKGGSINCEPVMCPVCQGNVVPVEGQCCGDCRSGDIQFTPGCEVNGTVYNVGDTVPTDDPCQDCRCYPINGGEVICAMVVCAQCAGKRVPTEGSCCGECQEETILPAKTCEWNGEEYKPGPIGDKCDGLFCEDGEVIRRPPVCAKELLTCVDSEVGEDCCPYCPNGTTCRAGRDIIKAGETKRIRNKECSCQEDPWDSSAFCARRINIRS